MRLRGLPAAVAFILCAVPVVLGFIVPMLLLLRLLLIELRYSEFGWPLASFQLWAWNSFRLAALAAALCVALALALAFVQRMQASEKGGEIGRAHV